MSDQGDKLLIIGSIQIPFIAGIDLTQSYSEEGGQVFHRMHSGALRVQRNWAKLVTEVSAAGWIAPPLAGLDTSLPYEISCIEPRAIYSSSPVIALPAARRSDAGYEPFGTALLPGNEAVDTPLVLAGNTATLTAVAGALQYSASYYPKFTAHLTDTQERHDDADATWSWSFTAREI